MLVLTRKLEEQIRIGDDIIISVLRVNRNTVRIGIEAPREIRVVRGELPRHDQIDTPPNVNSPRGIAATESVRTDEGTIPGDEESMKPATMAVRQFLAHRARRRPGGRKLPRTADKAAATAMARSA
jgi:carbon storage regulator CsrA